MAYDQVHHNMDILEPGMSYREIAERAWKIPKRFLDRRYPSIIHGVGSHGETPLVAHHMDFDRFSKDGIPEPGIMTSVESDIRGVGAADGVKLEEEVLITDTGITGRLVALSLSATRYWPGNSVGQIGAGRQCLVSRPLRQARDQLVHVHRAAQEVALVLLDPQRLQQLPLLLGLHTLGDGFHSEQVAQADDARQ